MSLPQRQQAAVHDAGVIALVGEDVFALAREGADDAEIDLEPGADRVAPPPS